MYKCKKPDIRDGYANFIKRQQKAMFTPRAGSLSESPQWVSLGHFEMSLFEFCCSFQTLCKEQVLFLKQENNAIKSSPSA